MGNVSIKTRHHSKDDVTSSLTSIPSCSSEETELSAPPPPADGTSLGVLLQDAPEEDPFTQAVLSFCSHMKGRMDALDNAKLYEEFCSYAATHSPYSAHHSLNMEVV